MWGCLLACRSSFKLVPLFARTTQVAFCDLLASRLFNASRFGAYSLSHQRLYTCASSLIHVRRITHIIHSRYSAGIPKHQACGWDTRCFRGKPDAPTIVNVLSFTCCCTMLCHVVCPRREYQQTRLHEASPCLSQTYDSIPQAA